MALVYRIFACGCAAGLGDLREEFGHWDDAVARLADLDAGTDFTAKGITRPDRIFAPWSRIRTGLESEGTRSSYGKRR